MWTDWETWTFIFTLVQTLILWCLYFTAKQIEFPFQAGELSYSVAELHKDFDDNLVEMARSRTGQLAMCRANLDPAASIHAMKSFHDPDEWKSHKTLSRRKSAVNLEEPSPAQSRGPDCCMSHSFGSEGSVQIQVETPCGSQIDGDQTWIDTSGAGELGTSASMAESKTMVPPDKQPNQEGSCPDKGGKSTSRKHTILSRHQPTGTKSTADERPIPTFFVPLQL